MNSTVAIAQEPTIETEIFWAMFTWVLPAICAFGVVTNFINIIIFFNKDLKENIYSYMLAYSVSDFFYCFFVFFSWISRSGYPIASTYLAKWYEIYMFFTALNGLGTMSTLAELAVSFDRIFMIKRYKFTKKISSNLVILIMFLISLGTAVVYCVVRGIREVETSTFYPALNATKNVTSYVIFFNSFGVSLEGQALYVVVTVVKNIGTIIVMVIVNLMLVVEMRKYWNRKMNMTKVTKAVGSNQTVPTNDGGSNIVSHVENDVIKRVKNQQAAQVALKDEQLHKVTTMVFSMFVLYIIGNLTNAVIGVCFIFYSQYTFFNMLLTFGDVPQFLCRGLNIFVYYKYNVRFREIFNSYRKKLTCW